MTTPRAKGSTRSRTRNTSTWASADKIFYTKGYRYQLRYDYHVQTSIRPLVEIDTYFIHLTRGGLLTIRRGFAWDGPSGPTIKTRNFMRGSLVHDALYWLMRNGHLLLTKRRRADRELYKMCREDGMTVCRAGVVYRALVLAGGPAANPRNKKKIYVAP